GAGAGSGDDRRLEVAKRGSKALPLAQDGQPAEAGHEPLEGQLLEEAPAVGRRPAPLEIVIAAVDIVRIPPPAPGHAIGPDADARLRQRSRLRHQGFELGLEVALHIGAVADAPLRVLALLEDAGCR